MKIAILAFPSMGGSGMLATRLAIELAREHEVHFITYQRPFLLREQNTIHLHLVAMESYALFNAVGNLYTIQLANTIVDIVAQYKIELLHAHYAIPHVVSVQLAQQILQKQGIQLKSVVTLHGSDVHLLGKSPVFNTIVKHALMNTDRVTAVSHFLSELAVSTYDLQPPPTVVYNFIDTDKFQPKMSERTMCIVHASNFRKIKRVGFLLRIFARVVADFPEWTVKLLGDGPERVQMRKLARSLRIEEKIVFGGITTNIPEEFASASILAAPSLVESFGLTICEAMATSTPVWATRAGGIPEACPENVAGLLFAVDDEIEAEEQLRKLMKNETLRHKLGKNGRAYVKTHFSIAKIVPQYVEIYKSILK